MLSVVEVSASVRFWMLAKWCSSPANMCTIWKPKQRQWPLIPKAKVVINVWTGAVRGGKPAAPGPEQRLVGRRYRCAGASRSVEPPWAQNRVGGFELIYRIPRKLPGEGKGSTVSKCESVSAQTNHTRSNSRSITHTKKETHSYLYDFWVIEPFAEDALDQREDFLEHNYNLKYALKRQKCIIYKKMCFSHK